MIPIFRPVRLFRSRSHTAATENTRYGTTDRWGELLEPGKGTYLDEIGDGVDVECVATYFDTQRKVQVAPGEIFRVSEERAETLFKNKVAIRCPEA